MSLWAKVRVWSCWVFSCTVAAAACWPANPPRSQEPGSTTEKQSGSKSQAQEPSTSQPDQGTDDAGANAERGLRRLAEDFLIDQKQIWTSPAKVRFTDTEWLVP